MCFHIFIAHIYNSHYHTDPYSLGKGFSFVYKNLEPFRLRFLVCLLIYFFRFPLYLEFKEFDQFHQVFANYVFGGRVSGDFTSPTGYMRSLSISLMDLIVNILLNFKFTKSTYYEKSHRKKKHPSISIYCRIL